MLSVGGGGLGAGVQLQGRFGWGRGLGRGLGRGRGLRGEGAGDISSTLPCTALPQGASPERDFAQQEPRAWNTCASKAAIANDHL